MNIESMIRDANPVNSSDLPDAESPRGQWLLHHIIRSEAPGTKALRRRPRALALSVAAGAAAAAAGVTALAVGLFPGPAGTALPGVASGPPQPAAVRALHKLSLVSCPSPARSGSRALPEAARTVRHEHCLGRLLLTSPIYCGVRLQSRREHASVAWARGHPTIRCRRRAA